MLFLLPPHFREEREIQGSEQTSQRVEARLPSLILTFYLLQFIWKTYMSLLILAILIVILFIILLNHSHIGFQIHGTVCSKAVEIKSLLATRL